MEERKQTTKKTQCYFKFPKKPYQIIADSPSDISDVAQELRMSLIENLIRYQPNKAKKNAEDGKYDENLYKDFYVIYNKDTKDIEHYIYQNEQLLDVAGLMDLDSTYSKQVIKLTSKEWSAMKIFDT